VITEEQIEQTVSRAEKSFHDCWDKLFAMKDAETLFSFQPTLLTALYQIEAIYQKVCKEERELERQKTKTNQKQVSERIQTLALYKSVLNQVVDIGKVLGDAFAWLFYEKEKQLLKKHYDHEFIPHLPMGTGGRKWGNIKVDRGLLLVGIKTEETPLCLQLRREALLDENSFKQNLESLKDPVNGICDKKLPKNFVITSWILYPADDRYFLPFGMKPFLWWPLDAAVRKAIVFQQFRVMTLYNPAFLIDELNRNGFNVQFDKGRKMKIVKKFGEKSFEFSGMDHFIGAVRTQFYTDSSIVNFVRMAVEKIEAENFKQPTHISVDLDFLHD
jgi:hypothetical protein